MTVYSREIQLAPGLKAGGLLPPVFIIGPCVIESETNLMRIAQEIRKIADKQQINVVFKSSFDKANRTSLTSFRGVGLDMGMELLSKVKKTFGFPLLTDVHETWQVERAAETVDVIQIPAFLIRQTDLVEAAAKTGKTINLKKGQFMSPWEMTHVAKKVADTGNGNYFLTERGTFFGYNRLVNDFKYFPVLKKIAPVCFDATHSVQLPGASTTTAGEPEYSENLALAAAASFADIFFMETHFSREEAKSDASNLILLDELPKMLEKIGKLSLFLRKEIFPGLDEANE